MRAVQHCITNDEGEIVLIENMTISDAEAEAFGETLRSQHEVSGFDEENGFWWWREDSVPDQHHRYWLH